MPVWQPLEELPYSIVSRRAQAPVQRDYSGPGPQVADTGPSRCTGSGLAVMLLKDPLQAAGPVDQPVLLVEDCDDAAIAVLDLTARFSVSYSPASS